MATAIHPGRGYVNPYERSVVLEDTPKKGLLSFIGRSAVRFLRMLGDSGKRAR